MAEEKWSVSGNYFEACNCEVTCPCIFLSAPTEGYCEVSVFWQIDKGSYGSVDLKGQKVAVVIRSPENMSAGGWSGAMYIDEGANPEQREALKTIFGGQAGGHPKVLVSFITEHLGLKFVPIKATFDGNKRTLNIPDVLEVEIVGMEGYEGKPVVVNNPPLAVSPGQGLTVAKTTKYKYKDYGLEWEWIGRDGIFAPFIYTGP